MTSPWVAALIVGLAVTVISAVLISTGIRRLKQVHPKSEKTIETMKENVRWVRNQTG